MARRGYRLGRYVETVKWPSRSRGVLHVLKSERNPTTTWCYRTWAPWWHRIRADWTPRRTEVCKQCLARMASAGKAPPTFTEGFAKPRPTPYPSGERVPPPRGLR